MMYEPRLCGTPGQINSDSGQFKFIEVESMLVAKMARLWSIMMPLGNWEPKHLSSFEYLIFQI
jgi:hypothetical protein